MSGRPAPPRRDRAAGEDLRPRARTVGCAASYEGVPAVNGEARADGAAVVAELRRAGERRVTRREGTESRHSFSFGEHYDAHDVGFGALIAHNDELVGPGAGFDWHSHRDVEIVTWVLEGRLWHRDSLGNDVVLEPGSLSVTDAASGLRHAERNASADEPLRFVQAWLPGSAHDHQPSFEARRLGGQLAAGRPVTVASGSGRWPGGVRLTHPGAALLVARLATGDRLQLPTAPLAHVYVARGDVRGPGPEGLREGDAARCRGGRVTVRAVGAAELMVWLFERG